MPLYLIIEHFPPDPKPIYERFREKGRLAPQGLAYVNSWVSSDLKTCYQIMETADRRQLDEWMANWEDLVEFEVHPVITSAQAADKIASR